MKILGNVGSSSLLVEMSWDEFARIAGYEWHHDAASAANSTSRDFFSPGRSIKVSDIYHRLRHQESVSNRLADAAKNLRALADLVEYASPAAEELTKQPEGGAK